jgi:carbonic anhydrase/acetyltransferase-like protein (isoleucine patch superfamily)
VNKPETAILVTGGSPATFGTPNELLPLLGRCLTQRAVETIAAAGIRDIHVVLGDDPLATRLLLSDGARWGCRISYHQAREGERVNALAKRLGLRPKCEYVLADAARLPVGLVDRLATATSAGVAGEIWVTSRNGQMDWTGWGRLDGSWLTDCAASLATPALTNELLGAPPIGKVTVADALSVATSPDILQAAATLLAGQAPAVAIGRGTKVDPSATLIAPVWLGNRVRIGARTTVGPGVMIGDGALLDEDSTLSQAVVLPDTFVGSALAIDNAVAGGNRLASVRLETLVEVTDPHLLSPASKDELSGTAAWRERSLALALKLCLLPLRLAVGGPPQGPGLRIPRPGNCTTTGNGMRLTMADPASAYDVDGACDPLHHFRDCFFPGLGDVVAGRMRLLGPTPRSSRALAELPEVWRQVYARSRPGLLQEGLLTATGPGCSDLAMASDAVSAATQNDPRTRHRVLRRYLGSVVARLSGRWTRARSPDYACRVSGTQRRIL